MGADPVQSLLSRARDTAKEALVVPDLEGHLVALMLRRQRTKWLSDGLSALRMAEKPALDRPCDVAIAGVRLALGLPGHELSNLEKALKVELSRKPLPPAPRAHDDERLMLGVAAGVAGIPTLRDAMFTAFPSSAGRSPRWGAVVLITKSLAMGGDCRSIADEATRLISGDEYRALTFKDAIALLWLASELFECTDWRPDDETLEALELRSTEIRNTVLIESPETLEALDAALVLSSLSFPVQHRFSVRNTIDRVQASFNAFPASVQILSKRPRGRAGVVLEDEYDVQWIVHALLVSVVPDIVSEDPAPQLAGKSSRLDFTSKDARLGIEIKHIRKKSDVHRIREELMVDERQYQMHPFVSTVVAFVHDPEGHVGEAERNNFERDLSGPITIDGRTITYVTVVR